jgi:alpha-glucosidase
LQYVLFDSKWYGPEINFNTDATTVKDNLDLPAIIEYAEENGIGIFLYVNQRALLKRKDILFPLYHKWGVKGIKFGFVNIGSQYWTSWLEEAIEEAANNNLLVNIHDEYRPTGTNRTWPNILTAEGIRGNEEWPDATHNTILPYTRMIAGEADYTVCYYDKRLVTTHAHQLALPVIFYSPLQTLFWYDKPTAFDGEPEIEFFEKVPVTWDDTRVLQGAPGEYVVIARRKGEEWFIGAITNNNSREITLDFDFLDDQKKYIAKTYFDNPKVETKTKVGIHESKVSSNKSVTYILKPSGGIAIWVRPSSKN